jgi:hypothetical protein
MTHVTPIINEPILIADNTTRSFIIADLHIGIEWDLHHSGITLPSQTDKLMKKITAHIKQTKPDQIVLLGDVKHNIPQISWQEKKEIPEFISELASHAKVYITPGNHDGDIEHLLHEQIDDNLCTITPAKGAIIDEIGYFHGHTWPAAELLQTPHIITAHNHPLIKLTDPLGYTTLQPVWIRTTLRKTPFEKHYHSLQIQWSNPELIITPAFNKLCGGIPFNETLHKELLGPIFTNNAVELHSAQAYLPDGTNLGSLHTLKQLTPIKKYNKRKKRKVAKTSYTR